MDTYRVDYMEVGTKSRLSFYCQAVSVGKAREHARQRARLTAGQWFITGVSTSQPHREGTFPTPHTTTTVVGDVTE